MKTLLIVDGNSIMNRAFYGVRPLTTKDGIHSNAVFGVVNILQKHLDAISPDYAAIAYDLKAPTFRHLMYDAYKAGRHAMPDELRMQVPYVKECTDGMGFHRLELEGYEADDILGTLSAVAEREGHRCYILTGDRDALQLISENVHVLLAGNKETTDMDIPAFREKYGVDPTCFVDVKALMGDSSDNIPGVPGIGEKTALKLIAELGSLDNIYETLTTVKHTPSLLKKLETGKDSAYLSQKLARICREVPLNITLDDLAYHGPDGKILRPLFEKLEFSVFLKRYALDAASARADESEETVATTEEGTKECRTVTADTLDSLLEIRPLAFAYTEDKATFFGGNTLYTYDGEIPPLVRFLRRHTDIVSYDAKQIYKRFLTLSAEDPLGCCNTDVMLMAYVMDSGLGDYRLERLVLAYLGTSHDPAVDTAEWAYRLYAEMKEKLDEGKASRTLLYDVEMPLAAVLADMEYRGIRVDIDGLRAYEEELLTMENDLADRVYAQAGQTFNINSPKQLGEILFETLMLPVLRKTKTGYSTDAETLNKLRPYHPIIDDILEYRQVAKLRSTYAVGLQATADEDARIHTAFRQTGTATGRLSSAEPNLQNIPVRTELGRRFRKFFIPSGDGRVLIDADYSQIELRLLAAISGDESMTKAFVDGVDVHASTASAVFGVPVEEVTPELRKRAKAVNFGIVYGIGDFSLAEDIGTTRKEAKQYIDSYFAAYPEIDAYLRDVVVDARQKGYTETLFGRRRYIPELAGKNKILQHFGERVAMNSPIQGTAADIIKIAMIRVFERLKESGIDAHLLLQVHDELLIEAPEDRADEVLDILQYEMENAVSVGVPLDVEAAIGNTWYDCK